MKKIPIRKRLLSIILVVAMVIVNLSYGGPTQAFASTGAKLKPADYLNATEKYLYLGERGANTFDFNINKNARKQGDTYTWYVKTEKGTPKAIAINKKTGVVTAKSAGTAYIRCKIVLADGTILRPEAKITVINNITEVGIKELPEKSTIIAGKEYSFDQKVLNTAAGVNAATKGITRFEIAADTAEVGSTTSEGVVFPIKEGSFQIRAVCFQSVSKYNQWSTDKSKYAANITAASEWALIKVATGNGTATVSNQEQLDKVLAEDYISQIMITTKEPVTFIIPKNNYLTKSLNVTAPNADVENHGSFKDITINAIKDSTWIEYADGNIVNISDDAVGFVIDKDAHVKHIVIDQPNSLLNIEILGIVDEIIIMKKATVNVSGSSETVPVTVEETAGESTITSSVPLNLDIKAKAEIVLAQGAEETTIGKSKSKVEVKIENNTQKKLEIVTDNVGSEKIESGTTVISNGTLTLISPQAGNTTTSNPSPSNPSTPSPTPTTEASLVQAYTDAASAAAFVTLLNTNALSLTLTNYAGLDATGKTAVGTALLVVDTFADKTAVQSAVTTAIANAKPASDARIAEAALVKDYTDAASASAFVTLLNTNALGLTLTNYAGLDATAKTAVGTALLAVNTFADKAAVQTAVTTAITNAKLAFDARILEAAQVQEYTDAISATAFVTLLDTNTLGLTLTNYAGLDATGKTAVGAALLVVNTFADKAAVQSAVTLAISNAKPASDARIIESAQVQAYTDAASAAAFVTLLNTNSLGLTLTNYPGLDATGKTAVGTALLAVDTFADKAAVQTAVTTAIGNAKPDSDARILEEAQVQAYTDAASAAAFVTLLNTNALGLTLTNYVGLDATGKTAVGTALLAVNTFADKAAVQTAVTTAIANAKPASDSRIAEVAMVQEYTDAASAAAFVTLLDTNALGLALTNYAGLDDIGKTAVGAALLAVNTFADKAAVQSAVTTAIANAKPASDARNTEEAQVQAYTDAVSATAFVTLLDTNALGLTLTNYAGLDATGKTEVGAALLVVDTFADKAAVQSAVTTTIANAKPASDARIAEAALVQAYTNAASAAAFVTLLNANALGLTLTDYEGLDTTGKTAVGAALLVVNTFADKAAVQSAVTTAITNAKPASDARLAEAALVQAYTDAASAAAFVTLLDTNALGLTLTDYTGLDITGKTAVGAALLAVNTFADKAVVQSAVTTAIGSAKPASDARILEASQVQAYTDAASASAFVTLLDANALGLTITNYAGLDTTGKTTVGAALLVVNTFADKAAVQSAVTTAIGSAKPASDARILEAAQVQAYTDAASAAAFITLLNTNALGLTLTNYAGLDTTGKIAVGTALLAVNTFADKAAVQSAVTTAIDNAKPASDARIAEAALVQAYTDAASAAAFVTLLDTNALGLTLTDYTGLDTTGKTTVGAALLAVNTFADKAAVQSAVTTAIGSAKPASDARILEASQVQAYTDAASAAAFVTLLDANALSLTLTNYAGLDATGKIAVGAALLAVNNFADKAAVQSAVTTAIANAKPASDARLAEAVLVQAYTDATSAASVVTLLNANALGLTLTNYTGLDATGKTAVGAALLAVDTFADKAAVQSAVTTAIANAKPASDARLAEISLVQAYTDAASAAAFVTLLDANALSLTLTNYAVLDATGKTAVGAALLAVDTFADKAAVQSAVTTAIANAKPASDARILEATRVQAYTNAASAAAFVTLLNSNLLGLTITNYSGFNAAAKTAVGTALLAVDTFADKAAVQSAVTTAITDVKALVDADNSSITDAKALITSTFTAAQDTDTNLLTSLNALSGMAEKGVTLTLTSSNANVAYDGAITYLDADVTGDVVVKINKTYGTQQTVTVGVTIPKFLKTVPVGASTYQYTKNSTGITLLSYSGTDTEVTIDYIDGLKVTEIATNAFLNNSSLIKITIGDSVTLQQGAIYGCNNVTTIVLGSSVMARSSSVGPTKTIETIAEDNLAFVIAGTYQLVGSVYTRVLNTDATLKGTSTIKGVLVTLTSPQTSMASAISEADNQNNTINVSPSGANDPSNLYPHVTSFDPTSGWSTVKAVYYSNTTPPSTEASFNSHPAYANDVLTEDGSFVIKVTAESGIIMWYVIKVEIY